MITDNENSNTEEMKNYYMYVYELFEGSNQTYDNKNLTFRFSGELEKVLANEKELDKDNYTLESGSTIVILKRDYLNTENIFLKLVYNDGGETTAKFNVKEIIINPQTFDGISTYFIIGIVSLMGIVGVFLYFKKCIINNC